MQVCLDIEHLVVKKRRGLIGPVQGHGVDVLVNLNLLSHVCNDLVQRFWIAFVVRDGVDELRVEESSEKVRRGYFLRSFLDLSWKPLGEQVRLDDSAWLVMIQLREMPSALSYCHKNSLLDQRWHFQVTYD